MSKFLALCFCFFLLSCEPSETQKSAIQIVEGRIGGKTYYVPKLYLKLKTNNLSKDSIYIGVMYSSYTPILEAPNDLWKKKEWYRNLKILAHDMKTPISFDTFAKGATAYLSATEVVGEEYGLIHQKQPEGYVQDHYDIWFEKIDNRYASYITCSEKLTESSVPQCNQNFFYKDRLHVEVTYNKVLLSKWKEIQENVTELFDSFESKQTAQKYLEQKLQNSSYQTP